jgi:hypothetical protein
VIDPPRKTRRFAAPVWAGLAARRAAPAAAQEPGGGQGRPGAGGPQSAGDDPSLAGPFVGITTDGTPVPGLFPVGATGVPTAPIRRAAEAFLAALSDAERAAVAFAVDDLEWRSWSHTDFYVRQGVSLGQMGDA